MKRYVLFLKIGLLVGLSLSIAFLLLKGLYFTAVMCFIILLGTAFSLYQDQRKMLQRMEHLIANIHYGDMNLSFPVPSTDGPEANLTRAMNEALSAFRTRLYNVVVAEAETDAWQKLIRVLTHEIMNSVTPITSLCDTLLSMSEDKDEEISHGLQTISTTGKGLLSFVESYRQFTRIPAPEPSLFYVKAFIERMIELARHQNPCDTICFHTEISPADLILYADENLIAQVVINLLKNAIQAIGSQPDGRIELRAYCNDMEEIWIEIKNNGPEIPSEIAEHIFIPFFTTKENGSGIGLSISRQIMRLSGGSLTLLREKETTFILKFK